VTAISLGKGAVTAELSQMQIIKSPYPYFGGKSKIMPAVWLRFGRVANLVDPFAGSYAPILSNPNWPDCLETANDINGHLTNFWRAVQAAPDEVAYHADYPVSEIDLHARGDWLFYRQDYAEFLELMRSDPEYYDAKSAGWWVWGACAWIAGGWGRDEKRASVKAQLPHLGNAGQGVNRQLPHLGGAFGSGQKGILKDEHASPGALYDYMRALSERMRRVRICCGDWSRVLGPSVTFGHGLTAVFLDPPYAAEAGRDNTLYNEHDSGTVAHDVREWAIANGDNPLLRIALCGYDEHDEYMPKTWERLTWKAKGGYGNQSDGAGQENAKREVIYFSPHCERQATLF